MVKKPSFVAQFTSKGGPHPEVEIDQILTLAENNPEGSVWFPTKKGSHLDLMPSSRCVVFCKTSQGYEAFKAKVLQKGSSMPNEQELIDLYEGHTFPCWWNVTDLERLHFENLEQVPGRHIKSAKNAGQSFAGTCTFAYWDFEDQIDNFPQSEREPIIFDDPNLMIEMLPLLHQITTGPDLKSKFDGTQDLHGVDFSGGVETDRGNSKLWIAHLCQKTGVLELLRGSENSFRRRDLAKKIEQSNGIWILDFPFGISHGIMKAASINQWTSWIEMCGTMHHKGLMKEFRDQLKEKALDSGVKWSTRRLVDTENGTTWFPLFEQLYRQTISGAAEVLFPLLESKQVAILPWNDCTPSQVIVSEGFPGAVLRTVLKIPPTGYKGRQANRIDKRKSIVRILSEEFFLPLTNEQKKVLVDDHEGDAIDAVLLLLSAKKLENQTVQHEIRAKASDPNAVIEGWFKP